MKLLKETAFALVLSIVAVIAWSVAVKPLVRPEPLPSTIGAAPFVTPQTAESIERARLDP